MNEPGDPRVLEGNGAGLVRELALQEQIERGADLEVSVGFGHFFALGKVLRLGCAIVDVRPRLSARCGEGADLRFVGQHRGVDDSTTRSRKIPPNPAPPR